MPCMSPLPSAAHSARTGQTAHTFSCRSIDPPAFGNQFSPRFSGFEHSVCVSQSELVITSSLHTVRTSGLGQHAATTRRPYWIHSCVLGGYRIQPTRVPRRDRPALSRLPTSRVSPHAHCDAWPRLCVVRLVARVLSLRCPFSPQNKRCGSFPLGCCLPQRLRHVAHSVIGPGIGHPPSDPQGLRNGCNSSVLWCPGLSHALLPSP